MMHLLEWNEMVDQIDFETAWHNAQLNGLHPVPKTPS